MGCSQSTKELDDENVGKTTSPVKLEEAAEATATVAYPPAVESLSHQSLRKSSLDRNAAENTPGTKFLEMAPENGEIVVNQYVLTKILGEGSQAQVRLATDPKGSEWAIKIIRKRLTLRRGRAKGSGPFANIAAPIAREIAIMKKLQHPNIVQLHEVLDLPQHNRLFIVMQYVNGGPVMSDKLEGNEPISENKARDLFGQLIKGLEYLHFHGIVHRDIKPSNLLVTQTGLLKINDFGVSAICEPIELEDEISEDEDSVEELNIHNMRTHLSSSDESGDPLPHTLPVTVSTGGSSIESKEDEPSFTAPDPTGDDLEPRPKVSVSGQNTDEPDEQAEEVEEEEFFSSEEEGEDDFYEDEEDDWVDEGKGVNTFLNPRPPQRDDFDGCDPDLPSLTLATKNLDSPAPVKPFAFAESPERDNNQDNKKNKKNKKKSHSKTDSSSGFLFKLTQTPRPMLPFVTPRAAAAASKLNPESEEYKRLHGKLYPPTPTINVQHDDIMNSPPIGTYAFFPPEACSFGKYNDVQYKGKTADLWAAGVTLYVLLYGKVPFLAETREEMFYLIRTRKLTFPDDSSVSPSAVKLLKRMLNKSPYQRYEIPSIKRSKWMRKGVKLAKLSHMYTKFIVPTQDELDAAVTEVDLSVGITPLVRSKSWTNSPFSSIPVLDQSSKEDAELENDDGAKGNGDENEDGPLPDLKLDTSSVTLSMSYEKPSTRPLSLPVRQLRPEPLQQMIENQNRPSPGLSSIDASPRDADNED